MNRLTTSLALGWLLLVSSALAASPEAKKADPAAEKLGKEVADKGWLLFAGHPWEIDKGQLIADRKTRGPTDLYLCRPDGSRLQPLTRTVDYSEYGGKFSHDRKKMLYRRLAADKQVNHDQWGAFGELVIADAGGSNPVVLGKDGEYPWATWSPDDAQIACLYKKEGKIRIHDLATKQVVKELPDHGIYQQMFWSPDGRRVVGTANLAGRQWNILTLDLRSGNVAQVSRAASGGGNCTPDWFQSDANRIIYSTRTSNILPSVGGSDNRYGFTFLMQGTADGKSRKLVFAQIWKHLYFGCTSPDDKYLVLADDPVDTMVVGEMRIMRLADAPIIIGLADLDELYPDAKRGPVFDLKLPNGIPLRGFEPDWTFAEVVGKK